ncbi:MAG: hypothetical protein ACJ78Q_17655, partial [Chloroflexia bacterium]
TTDANPIRSESREAAWGGGVEIKRIPASLDGEHVFLLKGVAEDGQFVVGLRVSRAQPGEEAPELVLMDVDSRVITEVAELPGDYGSNAFGRGWFGLAVDGDWVVWQEAGALKAYNVVTRTRTEINRATDSRGGIPDAYLPPSQAVSADHGIVVWAEGTTEKPEKDRAASVIKSADLATGQVSVIGKGGVNPSISWPTVAWIEADLSTLVEGQARNRLVTLDLQTGEVHRRDELRDMSEVAIYSDSIALMNFSMIFLENLGPTRRQVISPQQDGAFHSKLSLNDRLVAWVAEGPPRVWDRERESLVELDGYAGGGEARVVNGHTLAWESAPSFKDWMGAQGSGAVPDNLTIYVVDTSRLP